MNGSDYCMIIYKKTFENIKTLDCNFPIEDQYYANDIIAVVADGITRDPIGVGDSSMYLYEELLRRYPRPSGAELAAKVVIDAFKENSKSSLRERLIRANQKVKDLNGKYVKKCDYLQNDYYGAVASCAFIEGSQLRYAYICDCGVIVYDKKGNVKFQTIDDKKMVSDPYINKIGIPWHLPEARVIVRRDYRNNPNNIQDGHCVSYGAITGEKDAISFIKDGSLELDREDVVIVYTDGFANFLHKKEFIDLLLEFRSNEFEKYVNEKSESDYEKYGKEKTIVIMRQN